MLGKAAVELDGKCFMEEHEEGAGLHSRPLGSRGSLSLSLSLSLSVCVCVATQCIMACVFRSEDSFQTLVLSQQ